MKAFAYFNRGGEAYLRPDTASPLAKPRFASKDTASPYLSYVKFNINGFVTFEQFENFIRISFEIFGLDDGLHGFHIHEKPLTLLSNYDSPCKECCSHFNGGVPILSEKNPYGTPHGLHLGDLCFNINSTNGVASGTFDDYNLSIIPGRDNNIVGRSIVIHANQDDMGILGEVYSSDDGIESLITGNAGDRVACANIYYF
jgi:Cu-Zn family superoxide dismutase